MTASLLCCKGVAIVSTEQRCPSDDETVVCWVSFLHTHPPHRSVGRLRSYHIWPCPGSVDCPVYHWCRYGLPWTWTSYVIGRPLVEQSGPTSVLASHPPQSSARVRSVSPIAVLLNMSVCVFSQACLYNQKQTLFNCQFLLLTPGIMGCAGVVVTVGCTR